IGIGGGGGKETSNTNAWKEQRRDAIRKFASDLNSYRKSGRFPLQPSLDYRICSTQKLRKAFSQHFHLQRAGKVSPHVLTSRFSTAVDPLQPSPAEDALIRLSGDVEAYNRKLAAIRGESRREK